MTLSQTSSISGRMCELIITLILPRSEFIKSRIAKIWCGSSPIVGSSIIITSGFAKMASAIPTRWRKPFDKLPMILRYALRLSWQISITSSTAEATSRRGMPFNFARNFRYSSTRRSSGNGLFSGIKPMCDFAASGSAATLTPQISTLPESAGIIPETTFIVVLLPAPFGPKNPTISPRAILNDTLSIAFTAPYVLHRRRTITEFETSCSACITLQTTGGGKKSRPPQKKRSATQRDFGRAAENQPQKPRRCGYTCRRAELFGVAPHYHLGA